MSALGAGLLVAAGLVVFFLHIIKLALILGAAGFVLLLCAGVALGYENMGEVKRDAYWKPIVETKQKDIDTAVAANTTLQVDVNKIDTERQACSKSINDWKALAERAATVAQHNEETARSAVNKLNADRQTALGKAGIVSKGRTCQQDMDEMAKDGAEWSSVRAMLFPPEKAPAPADRLRVK
jgi:hypothetical protein